MPTWPFARFVTPYAGVSLLLSGIAHFYKLSYSNHRVTITTHKSIPHSGENTYNYWTLSGYFSDERWRNFSFKDWAVARSLPPESASATFQRCALKRAQLRARSPKRRRFAHQRVRSRPWAGHLAKDIDMPSCYLWASLKCAPEKRTGPAGWQRASHGFAARP